ncbi:hypothetical protein EC988_010408, partial [Linderina pennispora]
ERVCQGQEARRPAPAAAQDRTPAVPVPVQHKQQQQLAVAAQGLPVQRAGRCVRDLGFRRLRPARGACNQARHRARPAHQAGAQRVQGLRDGCARGVALQHTLHIL